MRDQIAIQPDLSLAEARALAAVLGPNRHACGLVTEPEALALLGAQLTGSAGRPLRSPGPTPDPDYRRAVDAVQRLSARLRQAVEGGEAGAAAVTLEDADLQLLDVALRLAGAWRGPDSEVLPRFGMDRNRLAHLRTSLLLDGRIAAASTERTARTSRQAVARIVTAARAMRRARPAEFPSQCTLVTMPERLLLEDALNAVHGRAMNSVYRGDVRAACAAFRSQGESVDLRAVRSPGGHALGSGRSAPSLVRSLNVARQA